MQTQKVYCKLLTLCEHVVLELPLLVRKAIDRIFGRTTFEIGSDETCFTNVSLMYRIHLATNFSTGLCSKVHPNSLGATDAPGSYRIEESFDFIQSSFPSA